jgi:YbbR domain-containing protein
VVGEKRSEVSLTVPLELTGVPEGLVIISRLPEDVQVRLNGPRTLLSAINPQQLSVALDLRNLQAGKSTFENLPARLKLPKRIEVTYISPASITLEADQKTQKVLAVKPRLKGEPESGFRLTDVRVDPPEVEVEGGARALRQLKEVPTEVVDVSGLDATMDRLVQLSFPDPTLRRVSRGPVDLHVEIVEEKVTREFLQVAVEVSGSRWVATPSAVNVRVEGGARTVSKLSREEVKVVVDPATRRAGKGPCRVVVRVPKGVQVLDVVPKAVELKMTRGATSGSEEGTESESTGIQGD